MKSFAVGGRLPPLLYTHTHTHICIHTHTHAHTRTHTDGTNRAGKAAAARARTQYASEDGMQNGQSSGAAGAATTPPRQASTSSQEGGSDRCVCACVCMCVCVHVCSQLLQACVPVQGRVGSMPLRGSGGGSEVCQIHEPAHWWVGARVRRQQNWQTALRCKCECASGGGCVVLSSTPVYTLALAQKQL